MDKYVTNYIHNCDTCIDCCIGNDQQILVALSYNKSFKVCIQEMLDIMDAFFRVIPMQKKIPVFENNISAPRTIDERKIVQFIEETLSKTLISKLGIFLSKLILRHFSTSR